MAKIKIKLDEGASLPTRATDGSVGYDVRAVKVIKCDYVDYVCDTKGVPWYDRLFNRVKEYGIHMMFPRYVTCHTGIHLKPEDGYYVELMPNSRWGKRGVITYSTGQIDPDYTGEVIAIFKLLPWWLSWGQICVGDVVGQFIVRHKLDADFEVVNELEETDRGNGGFGSTEKK